MALEYNGTTQYVDVGIWSIVNDLTIEALIKVSDVTNFRPIVAKYEDFGSPNYDIHSWLLRVSTAQKINFGYRETAPEGWHIIETTTATVSLDTITSVAVKGTFGDATSWKIYINGQEKTASWILGDGTEDITAGTNQVSIGRLKAVANALFKGDIHYVCVYNRTFSPSEIKIISESRGSDNIVDGMVGRWLMNEKPDGTVATGANSVIDISGQGNHGTPYNSPIYRAAPIKLLRPSITLLEEEEAGKRLIDGFDSPLLESVML